MLATETSTQAEKFSELFSAHSPEENRIPGRTEHRDGVPFLFDEFWTAKQRQSHSLHEVSYRACFKAELPAHFIERLTAPGDVVYDPFMGRGTTLVQAGLMDRRAVGCDINPLSVYLTRPRICPPTLPDIERRLKEIPWDNAGACEGGLLTFYHPTTLKEIQALRLYLLEREDDGSLDDVDDWIRMVALGRLTGHSPGFFSVYSLPPNQAVSLDAQAKINAKRGQTPPIRSVPNLIIKKSKALLKDGPPDRKSRPTLVTGSANHTPTIADASVDLVVTSPPFLDIVQYASDNWLRCWFAGINPAEVKIDMHKRPEDWTRFIHSTLRELARVVRPGGHIAFEVGEIRNGTIELENLVLQAMKGTAWRPAGVLINTQDFTKTANCWGVNNNSKGTNTNRIVIASR